LHELLRCLCQCQLAAGGDVEHGAHAQSPQESHQPGGAFCRRQLVQRRQRGNRLRRQGHNYCPPRLCQPLHQLSCALVLQQHGLSRGDAAGAGQAVVQRHFDCLIERSGQRLQEAAALGRPLLQLHRANLQQQQGAGRQWVSRG
jgi:hypothetical protein